MKNAYLWTHNGRRLTPLPTADVRNIPRCHAVGERAVTKPYDESENLALYVKCRSLAANAATSAEKRKWFDASETVWASIEDHRRAERRREAARVGMVWTPQPIIARHGALDK